MSPYHYIKLTKDNRIVIGGEDTPFKNSEIDAKLAEKKYNLLEVYLKDFFPSIKDEVVIEYKFCGAFSATKDNMAVIGKSHTYPRLLYNLGYGANGIIYSILGGQILRDIVKGKTHRHAHLFNPARETLL